MPEKSKTPGATGAWQNRDGLDGYASQYSTPAQKTQEELLALADRYPARRHYYLAKWLTLENARRAALGWQLLTGGGR